MRRDMDLIRRIALAGSGDTAMPLTELDGVEKPVFVEHVALMIEAGLVDGVAAGGRPEARGIAMMHRLTWQGHDFADSIRDESVWKSAKEKVIKPTGSWTFSLLTEVLKMEIKRHLPGLENMI